ncbi:MAG: hypothetical protein HOE86_14950, partial [Gemmatimonadetes bacterium]|nr:hypothetical protein [Gemmatimonadota bacterium]
FGSIQGGGPSLAGQIHTISLAQHIFGDGVVAVRALGDEGPNTIHLDFGGRADRPAKGVTLNCDVGLVWHCAFHASAFGPEGAIHSSPLGDFLFPFGAAQILKQIREMVHTGRSPEMTSGMIEAVAIAQASRTAHETGKLVAVEHQEEATT